MKKELIVNLDDIRIKGYVNRGYGMLEDGVTKSPSCITFENVYSEEVPYPMYAVNLSEYLSNILPEHDYKLLGSDNWIIFLISFYLYLRRKSFLLK